MSITYLSTIIFFFLDPFDHISATRKIIILICCRDFMQKELISKGRRECAENLLGKLPHFWWHFPSNDGENKLLCDGAHVNVIIKIMQVNIFKQLYFFSAFNVRPLESLNLNIAFILTHTLDSVSLFVIIE